MAYRKEEEYDLRTMERLLLVEKDRKQRRRMDYHGCDRIRKIPSQP